MKNCSAPLKITGFSLPGWSSMFFRWLISSHTACCLTTFTCYCGSKKNTLLKINLNNGVLLDQELIPRKIFYYKDRTRFKNLGEGIKILCKEDYKIFLLENIRNLPKEAGDFKYNKFKRAGGATSVNLVCYTLGSDGSFRKNVVELNNRFSIIPIRTQSVDKCGLVLYLNNDAYEKFAILNLNP